jgi:hypothetical protein
MLLPRSLKVFYSSGGWIIIPRGEFAAEAKTLTATAAPTLAGIVL